MRERLRGSLGCGKGVRFVASLPSIAIAIGCDPFSGLDHFLCQSFRPSFLSVSIWPRLPHLSGKASSGGTDRDATNAFPALMQGVDLVPPTHGMRSKNATSRRPSASYTQSTMPL